jgi:hypothetical protein
MDPEVARYWNDAMDRLREAKEHVKAGRAESAKSDAFRAAMSGQCAIMCLMRGRENDSKAGEAAIDARIFDWKTCSRPEDHVAMAERFLEHFADLSPPEAKLPFRP